MNNEDRPEHDVQGAAAPDAQPELDLNTVFEEELHEIGRRRAVAFGQGGHPEDRDEEDVPKDSLVGLALSGGGIRSAMFNHGLLQALSHRGLLRFVDYLSSVSGGGYIAGWFGKEVICRTGDSGNFHDPVESDPHVRPKNRIALAPQLGTDPVTERHLDTTEETLNVGQSDAKLKAQSEDAPSERYPFQAAGNLYRPLSFLPRYIGYTLPVTLLWICSWGFLATAFALFWRSFDHRQFRFYTADLGFMQLGDELLLAFLPAILLAIAWLVIRGASLLADEHRGVVQKVAIIAGLMALFFFAGPLVLVSFNIFDVAQVDPITWDSAPSIFGMVWSVLRDRVIPIIGMSLFAAWWGLLAILPIFALKPALLETRLLNPITSRLGKEKLPGDVRSWFVSRLNQVAGYLFWGTLLACFIAVAVYWGNGFTRAKFSDDNTRHGNWIAVLTFAAAVLQIIPLLVRGSLINSAQDNARPWQRMALGVLGYSCLIVPAFAIMHWMAAENISGYASNRESKLHREDVIDWRGFSKLADPNNESIRKNLECFQKSQLRLLGQLTSGDCDENASSDSDGADKAQSDTVFPSWHQYSQRPVLSVVGTARTWRLLCEDYYYRACNMIPFRYKPQPDSPPLNSHRNNFVALVRSQNEHVKTFNINQLPEWDLTAKLIGRAALLSDQEDRVPPNDAAHEIKSFSVNGVEVPKTLEPTVDATIPAKDEADDRMMDQVVVREFLQSRMDKMEDWTDRDQEDFWREWGQFVAQLDSNGGALGKLSITELPTPPDSDGWAPYQIANFNRYLLELIYPNIIRERHLVTTNIMPVEDQKARWRWLLLWGSLTFFFGFLVDANRDSVFFSYYSERLSDYYLRANMKRGARRVLERPLREFNTCERGGPYHLISSALMKRAGNYGEIYFDSFVFTRRYCYSEGKNFVKSKWFPESGNREVRVADAIAVSGAAVTPLMTANPALRIVMRIFNFSLGAFVPNPKDVRKAKGNYRFSTAYLRTLWASLANSRSKDTENWSLSFVADGGFREFLGVEELLRRRCRIVIASDAGCNEGSSEFSSLSAMIRLARIEHGIEFLEIDQDAPLSIDRFRRPDATAPTPQQFICARIRYPKQAGDTEAPPEGLFVYLHMALTGREDVDLQQFRQKNPEFPYESTSNQFFTHSQVESYRQLGYHIGKLVCHQLPPWLDAPTPEERSDRRMSIEELMYRLKLGYSEECLRETAYDDDDLTSRALFDLDENKFLTPIEVEKLRRDEKVDTFFAANPPEAADPDEALRRYEGDADFRLRWRKEFEKRIRVSKDYRTVLEGSNNTSTPILLNQNLVWLPRSPGDIALRYFVLNEYLTPLNESKFQIGGRARLLHLASDLFEILCDDGYCRVPLTPLQHDELRKRSVDSLRQIFHSRAELTNEWFLLLLTPEIEPLVPDGISDGFQPHKLLVQEGQVFASRSS